MSSDAQGRMQRTDSAGMARFLIPAGAYKFRVDCNSTQYWSDVINVLADEETAVDLALDLLAMDLTNDPDPVRFDGTPPKLERKSVLLASLFDITGLLARSVFADTGDDDAVYYYINDHLGTPRLIIDETNHIVWRGDYQPFGSVDAVVSDLGNNFRFAGQYYDEETGLHYNYHRYYDPSTGRYITADPIGLAGMDPNLYGYVLNNPVNWIDPTGLFVDGGVISVPSAVIIGTGAVVIGAAYYALLPAEQKQAMADDVGRFWDWLWNESNNNEDACSDGTIYVDPQGNAIPTPNGGGITGSPNGDYVQGRDANGNPTGVRKDGGHNPAGHPDPRAQQPHGHVPGVTNPDGTPWLPVK